MAINLSIKDPRRFNFESNSLAHNASASNDFFFNFYLKKKSTLNKKIMPISFLPPKDFTLGNDNESWMTNMDIQKDPIKGVFTQFRQTKNEREQYKFEEDITRYDENIEKFQRGVDPMKELQMNNTKGIKQAYKPIINQIIRVPAVSDYDLQPLSRQPVESYNYTTNKVVSHAKTEKGNVEKRTIQENNIVTKVDNKTSVATFGSYLRDKIFKPKMKGKVTNVHNYETAKRDQVKTDFEKLQNIGKTMVKEIQPVDVITTSKSSHVMKNQNGKQDNRQMKEQNEIAVDSVKSKGGFSKVEIDESPDRGIAEEKIVSVPIQSRKHQEIDGLLFEGTNQKLQENPIQVQRNTVKSVQTNQQLKDTVQWKFQDKIVTTTVANKSLVSSNSKNMRNQRDSYLVKDQQNIQKATTKNSAFQKLFVNDMEKDQLPERVLNHSSTTAKNSVFQKLQNIPKKIELPNALPTESFVHNDVKPWTERDENVPPSVLRDKNLVS